MIVNGWSDNHKGPTEVLNLVNPEESCQLPDFPENLIWSVGGYTEDGALICSGRDSHTWSETNGCFLLEENSGEFVRTTSNLTFPRSLAGSVVTDDEQLWVLGGYNAGQPLMTTELYGSIQTTDDLSISLYGFCVVKINQTTAMGNIDFLILFPLLDKHINCLQSLVARMGCHKERLFTFILIPTP